MSTTISNFNETANQSTDPDIWLVKGNDLANLGDYEEALSSFNKVVAIQPQNTTAWVQRSVVLIHLNRYLEAVDSCDRALEIDDSDRQAWLFRGAALNHLGRYKECYASYDKSLGIEQQTLRQKLSFKLKSIWHNSSEVKAPQISNISHQV
ncbi:tetratricopeptide repeat protein [Synechocystis sp. PCC 7509]|uniref:tetratricopeptide repeat protein n=1 Tax=Synechocystis sp. PCC 7509 TaxID=927677 RepID=UPI0002AC8C43|nr:tetratricopeptide repeat protein [Synechocystis sp. PCC 7509]